MHGVTRVQRSVLVRIATDAEIEGWGNVDPSPGYTLLKGTNLLTYLLSESLGTSIGAGAGSLLAGPAGAAAGGAGAAGIATIIKNRRIASPEMFPEAEMLPHLICSRPMFIGGAKDEADQHGGA